MERGGQGWGSLGRSRWSAFRGARGETKGLHSSSLATVTLNPNLEQRRCPPGHGDVYPSLLGSGFLERLLGKGVKYLFVSNSDNLGATLSVELLAYFAKTDKAFLMEVRCNICYSFGSALELILQRRRVDRLAERMGRPAEACEG